jgi:hypothetical protein
MARVVEDVHSEVSTEMAVGGKLACVEEELTVLRRSKFKEKKSFKGILIPHRSSRN